MSTEDTIYPLQCETKVCHFNMCYSCTEKLLIASHQGPQMASDGNVFVNKLQCPICRGAFLVGLEDILLLRESDQQGRLKLVKDSELNAKDLRKKYNVSDEKLNDIDRAKDVYLRATMKRSGIVEDDIERYMSKLDVKESQTKSDIAMSDRKKKIEYIDQMVLCGLESSMSKAERDFVVQLMTSGCTNKLVQAAHLFSSIIRMNAQKRREGMAASSLQRTRSIGTTSASHIVSHKRPSQPYIRPQSPSYSFRMSSASLLTKRCPPPSFETETKQRLKWSNLYPLPFRMPRANRLVMDFDPRDPRQSLIRFLDDEESLSFLKYNTTYSKMSFENRCELIRDAFSTFSVSPRGGTIIKKDGSRFDGAENILLHLEHNIEDRLESDCKVPWRRVFVSFVHGTLQRKTGLRVGDVVTHLDGEPFDGNAEKLRFLLAAKRRGETIGGDVPTVEIVTNADISVAEVLRLRSLAARNQNENS